MKTHSKNMTSGSKKTKRKPDSEYLAKLGEFIETHHDKLLGYATFLCRHNPLINPEELFHDLVCDLYDGTRTQIDFTRSPLTAIQDMLRSKRSGMRVNRQRQFDNQIVGSVAEIPELQCFQPEYDDVYKLIPQLLKELQPAQRQYIEWQLQGDSLDDMVEKKGWKVRRETIKCEISKATVIMRKKAKALLQDDPSNGQAHRQ